MRLERDNLVIRQAVIADAPLLGNWWRDGQIMAHAGFPLGLDISDEEIAESVATGEGLLILEIDAMPAGEMSYRSKGTKTAQIGIKICDFSQQGKGYGAKLLDMLIYELFVNLDFEKIILDTNLNNRRAQKIYKNLGFRRTGILLDSWENQLGELQSSIEYELIKDEYVGFCD